jgi:hypothetical protein
VSHLHLCISLQEINDMNKEETSRYVSRWLICVFGDGKICTVKYNQEVISIWWWQNMYSPNRDDLLIIFDNTYFAITKYQIEMTSWLYLIVHILPSPNRDVFLIIFDSTHCVFGDGKICTVKYNQEVISIWWWQNMYCQI